MSTSSVTCASLPLARAHIHTCTFAEQAKQPLNTEIAVNQNDYGQPFCNSSISFSFICICCTPTGMLFVAVQLLLFIFFLNIFYIFFTYLHTYINRYVSMFVSDSQSLWLGNPILVAAAASLEKIFYQQYVIYEQTVTHIHTSIPFHFHMRLLCVHLFYGANALLLPLHSN